MEEQIRFEELEKKCFITPDGYFENFTEKIMSQITPKEAKHAKVISLQWWRSIAAVAVISISFAAGYFMRDPVNVVAKTPTLQDESTASMDLSDEELDAALDYEMVQNSDITYYLMVE